MCSRFVIEESKYRIFQFKESGHSQLLTVIKLKCFRIFCTTRTKPLSQSKIYTVYLWRTEVIENRLPTIELFLLCRFHGSFTRFQHNLLTLTSFFYFRWKVYKWLTSVVINKILQKYSVNDVSHLHCIGKNRVQPRLIKSLRIYELEGRRVGVLSIIVSEGKKRVGFLEYRECFLWSILRFPWVR